LKYLSTRGQKNTVSNSEAISAGLAKDGGLYTPESFPAITSDTINNLINEPYYKRASYIMGLYMDDFNADELTSYTKQAYNSDNHNSFNHKDIAPLYFIDDTTAFLELWHGPTCAFKDMALQILPYLLTASLKKTGETKKACILVATSGDTGKAALEGFCDIPDTKIIVFYPKDGVSEVQKLQMTSQEGSNVNVTAVDGNFDDTQTYVKAIFSDKELSDELKKMKYFLSSANSINWGRLVPQIAYYVSAYCDLVKKGKIKNGQKINFCVPTGNFGNILAGYYAEKMGLPINKLICASNKNDVLTQFLNTGVYNKNRPFYLTSSPSMDILVSSNLERLLFELSDKNGKAVSNYMAQLSSSGTYTVPDDMKNELNRVFASGQCDEKDTMSTIKTTFNESNYLIDTHTSVAYKVLNDYRKSTGDKTPAVVISTASPFKFCESVLDALSKPYNKTGAELLESLSNATGVEIPAPLAELKGKNERFNKSVTKNNMKSTVIDFIRND